MLLLSMSLLLLLLLSTKHMFKKIPKLSRRQGQEGAQTEKNYATTHCSLFYFEATDGLEWFGWTWLVKLGAKK
jgi:hypothetical protein